MNLSLSDENLFFELFFFICKCMNVFVDLLNLDIHIFLNSSHDFIFNCLGELFNYWIQVLNFLGSETNLTVNFLMDLLNFGFFLIVYNSELFFNHLNLICNLFVDLSKVLIDVQYWCLVFLSLSKQLCDFLVDLIEFGLEVCEVPVILSLIFVDFIWEVLEPGDDVFRLKRAQLDLPNIIAGPGINFIEKSLFSIVNLGPSFFDILS